ncbi:MAG TPA: SHOCT domain-containing protein [Gaiellaceae bacterium]|nr:SHOCT domain-containing protein [Gaiellaceae bacterium]
MIAANYPFLDILWTMFIFFAWVIWFWLLITIFADVFRRHDIGGGTKTLWCIFVIVTPFIGVFVYLISQSKGMNERNLQQVKQQRQQTDEYIRSVAAEDPASQISQAKSLLDSGAINQQEFDSLKQKALAGG